MVVMSEVKETSGNQKDSAKKICPRAARENVKKKSEIHSIKTAHTGLRFHFDRKKLVTHNFSSSTVSKTEKVSRCHMQEKSVEKHNKDEGSNSADSKKISVLMDTLKISKSEVSCSREKSPLRKEMPMSPVVQRLTTKKDCSRCSRCSKASKEVKPEIKPLKAVRNQEPPIKPIRKETHSPKTVKKENQAPKTVKLETSESSKTTCKKQCSKLAKLLAEPQEKVLKPKSILKHTEKSAPRDDEKNEVSKNCDKSQNAEKTKSCSADKGKTNCASDEKPEFWPKSGSSPEMHASTVHDREKSEIVNGSDMGTLDSRACHMNGRHDEHLCDPHFGHELSDGDKKELESVKLVSKIPRKTNEPTGNKPDANMNKVTIPQPFSFDLVSQNIKNEQPETVSPVY